MNNFNAIVAAIGNLQLYKNDGVILDAYITNPNQNDQPVDLSDLTNLTMEVKRSKNDIDYLVQLTEGNGLNIEGLGVLRIDLSDTDTDLVPGTYYYDVQGLLFGSKRTIELC